MNFTWDNSGTSQQIVWAQAAVAACTYPLDSIDAAVDVVWGPLPDNADSTHPYMVTQPTEAGFTITVATWSDEPKAPGNQGLPDPAGDVEDFYTASFTHELGHVVIDSTFNPDGADTDPRVATCCALFWTPTIGNGGRRYGTIEDWDASVLSWGGEIREAAAECFKLAFCSSDTVFGNRTKWNIDLANWPAFLALIGGSAWFDDFSTDDLSSYAYSGPSENYTVDTDDRKLIAAPGQVAFIETTVEAELSRASMGITGYTLDPDPYVGTAIRRFASFYVSQGLGAVYVHVSMDGEPINYYSWDEDLNPVYQGEAMAVMAVSSVAGDSGWGPTVGDVPDGGGNGIAFEMYQTGSDGPNYSDPIDQLVPLDVDQLAAPFWLALDMTADGYVGALWDHDPAPEDPGSPSVSVSAPYVTGDGPQETVPIWLGQVIDFRSEVDDVATPSPVGVLGVTDLRFGNPGLTAPYPFSSIAGSISSGSALRGSVTTDGVGHHGRLPIAGIATEIGELAITTQSTNLRGLSSSGTLRGAVTVDG